MIASSHLLIRASAGSGKTYRLSNRYIALLLAGIEPSRILATTFTRAAAAEILHRVFTRLLKACRSEEERERIGSDLKRGVTQDECVSALLRLANEQHLCRISTLDSFFAELATLFSSELGIPSSWRIGDTNTLTELWEEALFTLLRKEDFASLQVLFDSLHDGVMRLRIASSLRGSREKILGLISESSLDVWGFPPQGKPLGAADREALAEALLTSPPILTKAGKPNKVFENSRQTLSQLLRSGDMKAALRHTLVSAAHKSPPTFSTGTLEEDTVTLLHKIGLSVANQMIAELSRRTRAFGSLMFGIGHFYAEHSRESGLFGFSDLKSLLAGELINEPSTALAFRLDAKIDHLLFDEFQDTSLAEWRILERTVDEVLSDPQRSFFCVGDPKQAIYGWRGGEALLMDSVQQRYSLETESLAKSYRSSQTILDFVNEIFTNVPNQDLLNEFPGLQKFWRTDFSPHQAIDEGLAGYIEWRPILEDPSALAPLQETVKCIEEIRAQRPGASIGVLFRKNRDIGTLHTLLARAGINTSDEAGSRLTDQWLVREILSLLKLIEVPHDSLAAFHIATGKLGTQMNFREWSSPHARQVFAREHRQRLVEHGLGPFLLQLVTPFQDRLPERDATQISQLLQLAYLHHQQGVPLTRNFRAIIEETRVPEPDESAVRIMTIHKSKGLEFDVVILPELTHCFFNSGRQDTLFTLRNDIFSAPDRVALGLVKDLRHYHEEIDHMISHQEQVTLQDELCNLYVALTRARHANYCIFDGRGRTRTPNFASVIASTTGRDTLSPWAIGDRSWGTQLQTALHAPRATQRQSGKLKFRTTGAPRSLPRLKPAQQSGVGLPMTLRTDGNTAAVVGTGLHRLFEQVEWSDAYVLDQTTLQQSLSSMPISPEHKAQIVSHFSTIWKDEKLLELLARKRYPSHATDCTLYRELPFMFSKDQRVISGVIDRLVVFAEDGNLSAEIIDFKTGEATFDSDRESLRTRYGAQIAMYIEATTRIFGVPARNIRGTILLLGTGSLRIIQIDNAED